MSIEYKSLIAAFEQKKALASQFDLRYKAVRHHKSNEQEMDHMCRSADGNAENMPKSVRLKAE